MEIRNLITFQKICELGSFSKTAEELGYSQSAITMQIKQLESELDVILFDRINKSIRMTDDGRRLLSYADAIISTTQKAIADLTSDSIPGGELRIGVLESVCMAYIPNILSTYHSTYKNVSTIIKTGTLRELSAMLNTNQIDLLWIFDNPIDNPQWVKAFSYDNPICVVCSAQNSLAHTTGLILSDIVHETFLLTEKDCSYRRVFEEHMLSLGHPLRVFLEMGNTEVIKRFVEADLGLAVLPNFSLKEELASNKIAALDFDDYQLSMQGQIFYNKSKWLSKNMETFLNLVTGCSFE